MRLSLCSLPPLCNPVRSSRSHTLILRERVTEMRERRTDGLQIGEWDHYLGDGREEALVTTGTCVWTSASGVPRVYQCVNTELTVRQPKTVEKRVKGEMGSKVTVLKNNWIKNVTVVQRYVAALLFFLSFYLFLQQWWQMSVNLKWETSKTIFKWLFIGMLGGF